MCGILGYTGPNIEIVKRAHALQAHRGPDGEGFYSNNCISLGHNRLAIIDLNPRSAQPMWDMSNRYCIVFNGEIYNYLELKRDHLSDYVFKTESDTEVILGLFAKYGTAHTQFMRGMYAYAIYDIHEKKVYLFRDAFGIKPLFYSLESDTLFFASELKSVVSMLGATHNKLTLNNNGVSQYLVLGSTITPETLYNQIKILPGGNTLIYSIDTGMFKIEYQPDPPIAIMETADLLKKTILENLIADVPVGIFFSGGIDSSLITSTIQSDNIHLNTFTLAVSNRTEDAKYSKAIADYLHISPNIQPFGTKEFDSIYHTVIKGLDHPAGSISIFQTFYLASIASISNKVVLMGDGGDELFYGYTRSGELAKLAPQTSQEGTWLEYLYFYTPKFPAKNALFLKLFKFFSYSLSYYLITMSISRGHHRFSDWAVTKKSISRFANPPQDLDKNVYLSNDLLHKNDLATSLCSIEGRVPLLDRRFYNQSRTEAAASLTNNSPKEFLRSQLLKHVPLSLINRKKSGFGIDYKKIVSESHFIKNDFNWSVKILADTINVPAASFTTLQKHNPQYILALISLAKALDNNNTHYTNAQMTSSKAS